MCKVETKNPCEEFKRKQQTNKQIQSLNTETRAASVKNKKERGQMNADDIKLDLQETLRDTFKLHQVKTDESANWT